MSTTTKPPAEKRVANHLKGLWWHWIYALIVDESNTEMCSISIAGLVEKKGAKSWSICQCWNYRLFQREPRLWGKAVFAALLGPPIRHILCARITSTNEAWVQWDPSRCTGSTICLRRKYIRQDLQRGVENRIATLLMEQAQRSNYAALVEVDGVYKIC